MNIGKIGSGFIRPPGEKSAKVAGDEGKEKSDANGSGRSDQVGISEAGMAFAAKASEIEVRIQGGVYNDPAMAEEVARRILDSGDLDVDV